MDDSRGPEVTLGTPRLLLRPWRVSDAALQRQLWTERDPRVPPHRRIDAAGSPTLQDIESGIRAGRQEPPPGLLAAERKDTAAVIGYCGLIPNTYGRPDEPELAYEFLRDSWGHGFATEAGAAVVEAARATGYARLWATVRAWNVASFRVLAKLGFVESGRVDSDAVHGDSVFTVKDLR